MSIIPLPDYVAQKITASTVVTSLEGVVGDLVRNSLDARATRIHIDVNFALGSCIVEDNGSGIPACEFRRHSSGETPAKSKDRCQISGGLARARWTSKWNPLVLERKEVTHGWKGIFLASLTQLALVTIVSNHKSQSSPSSATFYNGRAIACHTPAPEYLQETVRYHHGTRVSVADLFGAMPVRVKERNQKYGTTARDANCGARNRAHIESSWTKLLHMVVSFLLSWESANVSVDIRETGSNLHVSLPASIVALDNPMSPSRISRLCLRATHSVHPSLAQQCWDPVTASTPLLTLDGWIARSPIALQFVQFISVGVQSLVPRALYKSFYETVNNTFTRSNFVQMGPSAGNKIGSPDKWPAYAFKIYVKHEGDASLSFFPVEELCVQNRLQSAVIDLLRTVVHTFLKRHGFYPGRSAVDSHRLPEKKRKGILDRRTQITKVSKPPSKSLLDTWIRRKRPCGNVDKSWGSLPGNTQFDGMRTQRSHSHPETQPVDTGSAASSLYEPLSTLSPKLGPSTVKEIDESCDDIANKINEHAPPYPPDIVSRHITKSELARAAFVGQVDCKYLLLRVSDPLSSAPFPTIPKQILVDQHAADERCILEDILSNYFPPVPSTLGHPSTETPTYRKSDEYHATHIALTSSLPYEVTVYEAKRLSQLVAYFRFWGIHYHVSASGATDASSPTYPTICTVLSLPPSIVTRCLEEPKLLIDLLRTEIYKPESVHSAVYPSTTIQSTVHNAEGRSAEVPPWVTQFRTAPEKLLPLLHSRACRSAVMFNDKLTPQKAVEIIQRLQKCCFPFQCAHGRPSVIPIVPAGSPAFTKSVLRTKKYKSYAGVEKSGRALAPKTHLFHASRRGENS